MEDRKDWLRGFKTGTHADYNVESVTYESFINQELILFSVSAADTGCARVMPLCPLIVAAPSGVYFFFFFSNACDRASGDCAIGWLV